MLARKIFFFVLPPLVLACIGGGVYWRIRANKASVDEPVPPPIVQPTVPEGPASQLGEQPTTAATTQENATAAGQSGNSVNQDAPKEQSPASFRTAEELLAKAPAFSDSPFWAKLLAQTTPAMRLVKTIDAIANGERPLDPLDFLQVETSFSARRNAEGTWVATAESYARYQTAVDFVTSLDPQMVAEWFEMAEPVLQQCCKKLGYQDKNIRQLLTEAFNTILTTPKFDFDPQLVPTGTDGIYHFADPVFEQLNDAQKLLVRLGPANCAKLQAQCSAIADALHLYK